MQMQAIDIHSIAVIHLIPSSHGYRQQSMPKDWGLEGKNKRWPEGKTRRRLLQSPSGDYWCPIAWYQVDKPPAVPVVVQTLKC